jgi:hypothetical protein
MSLPSLSLTWMPELLAICRLAPDAPQPEWLPPHGGFVSVTRTADELSIVCDESAVPATVRAERGYRALSLPGPIPFTVTGVLAAITLPLFDAGIGLLAISTYDTDHVLVKEADAGAATAALRQFGHAVDDWAP